MKRSLLFLALLLSSCTSVPNHDGQGGGTSASPSPPLLTSPQTSSGPSRGPGTPPPGYPPEPVPRKSSLPTTTHGVDLRASGLNAHTRCGPPGTINSIVDLAWKPASRAGTQRIAYTPYADGYRTGRYSLTPELAPGVTVATVEQLSPAVTYTWLVQTLQGDTWEPSGTAKFESATCVADGYPR